jgi:mono/diheme cytochrome c family protein
MPLPDRPRESDMPRRLAVIAALLLTPAARAADVDFARDVMPLLADKCFHCHGPDGGRRAANLRLDTKEGAFRTRYGVTPVAPGKSAASEVIRRILSTDPDEVMPPPDSNRTLTPAQRETLKAWIDQGAKWSRHWALEPLPAAVAVPPGAADPIDAFVRARLKAEKLHPAPEAGRAVWLRRVTFDLTGLPPTPGELDAFAADKSLKAYDAVLDRLFASPRYGERMASDWLDLARYADTHGYQADRAVAVWPYRDWVISAFNRNQPFDRFLTEQLAGDLLPNPTRDQQVATAFNRLHVQNEEGGVVEEEFRVSYVVDRVNTMGTAFLGLTLDCTRCHDHKFDPLTQKDYYGLFSMFQNIDESGQTSHFTQAAPVPALNLPTDAQEAESARLRKVVADKEAALTAALAAGRERLKAIRFGKLPDPLPDLVARYTFEEWPAGVLPNVADAKHPGRATDNPLPVPGHAGNAALFSGDNGFTLPGVGPFTRDTPFTLSTWVKVDTFKARMLIAHQSKAPIDAGSRGYDLLLEDGRVALGLYHMWPGNALKVRTKAPIPAGKWAHVTASYDGSSRAAGVTIFVNGEPQAVEVVRDGLTRDITYGGTEPDLALGFRFRDAGLTGGALDDFAVYARALTGQEVRHLAGKPANPDGDFYLSAVDADVRKARAELQAARAAVSKALTGVPQLMVMRELPTPKPAFVLTRGAYDAPGLPVTPATPAALPPMPAALPRNRLGLAKWLTQPDHPLTARVTVNRLWQQMFGRGLVETSDNFGTTGSPPTHPELLDWLARDFVAHGWDVRRTLRLMALSQTYRQSSRGSADAVARDPENKLLARVSSRRMTAEMLRDQALAASGLLVERVGGPSVYPYQPEGFWAEANATYPQSTGDGLRRRSVYTVWKRTAPHPQLTTFDAADRSTCSARRQSTSTPLQALALLNDPQVVEAARALAAKMLREPAATRSAWLVRAVTSRPATDREAKVLDALFAEQLALFRQSPADAAKFLAVGDTKVTTATDPATLAAATVSALAVLNHADAVTRR